MRSSIIPSRLSRSFMLPVSISSVVSILSRRDSTRSARLLLSTRAVIATPAVLADVQTDVMIAAARVDSNFQRTNIPWCVLLIAQCHHWVNTRGSPLRDARGGDRE